MSDQTSSGRPLDGPPEAQPVGDGTRLPPPAPDTGSHAHGDADQGIHTELDQLRRAMQTRPTIDQACGILMATFGLNPQTAWRALVMTSQNTNTKLHRLADDLVATIQGSPLPKAVRDQLADAIATLATASDSPDSAP